jgi:senataxin
MTTTLAVIYKRTVSWAGWFDNAVMTEWMRDALILGSQLCDKVRMFESAVLGVTGPTSGESPARVSNSGMTLVARLHIVLRDLTLWLRLTE